MSLSSDQSSVPILPIHSSDQSSVPILPIHAPQSQRQAVDALRRGEIIAYPTDTLYGVGGDARSALVAERVVTAKGREASKGMPILLANASEAESLVAAWPAAAAKLASRFWPGGLTIVVASRPELPELVRAGATAGSAGTVAVRVPAQEQLRQVIAAAGVPLIGTSANRSGEPPALTAEAAARALGRHVALTLDGGPAQLGQPSTVIAVAEDGTYRILREGAISAQAIAEALG